MNQRAGSGAGGFGKDETEKKVVDFNQVREQRLEEKRRKTERFFFKNQISVFSVVDPGKMHPVEMIDVSEDGCSFQVPFSLRNPLPWPQESNELPIRLYFSQDTFLELKIQIQNSRPVYENDTRYVRFGCTVDKTLTSYPAYQQFVRFLKLYAEHSHKDMGDMSIFYPS